MSNLRDHLDAMKAQYQSARYPGDLAAQVMLRRPQSPRGRWVVFGIAAAAAAMFLVLWLNLRDFRIQRQQEIAQETAIDEPAEPEAQLTPIEFAIADMPAVHWPELSDEVDFAPAPPDFSLGVPSFSLIESEVAEEENSNQQESVL